MDDQQQGRTDDEVGALWHRQSPKGDYMAGEVTLNGRTTKIVVFPIKKKSDKQPDFRILRSKWQGEAD